MPDPNEPQPGSFGFYPTGAPAPQEPTLRTMSPSYGASIPQTSVSPPPNCPGCGGNAQRITKLEAEINSLRVQLESQAVKFRSHLSEVWKAIHALPPLG